MESTACNGNVTISYQIDGAPEAPALLLIHSIGSTRELWAGQMAAFSAAFRVIRYDARGHGRSSVPPGDYTIEQLGQDALAVLDHAGVQSAHLCGLSLGGITALWMAVHAPARIERLIVANTAARIATADVWTQRMALVREQGMAAAAEAAMQRWFSPAFRERDPTSVRAFRTMVEGMNADGYLGCCAALRDADLRDRIGEVTAPTLAIAASEDAATPPENLGFIHARIAGARLITLPGGHMSNVEQPGRFTAAVMDFVEERKRG